MTWCIVSAACDGPHWFRVELERCDGACASALVGVLDRNRRGAAHEPWDPQVTVAECDEPSAQEWLEALEHEYYVAEQCVRRSS